MKLHVNRLDFALRRWGREGGPRILALHGWLDSSASFEPMLPWLEAHAELVAPDLAGHGFSQHRPSGSYNGFEDAADVIAIADALGWQRFRLIGHSMGANIAVLVAGAWPERIERVALIDGYGPFSATPEETPARLAAGAAQLARVRERPPTRFQNLDAAIERYCQHRSGLSEASARLLLARGARRLEDGSIELTHDPGRHAATLFRPTEEQVLAFLADIQCPVYAVRARSGWPVEAGLLERRIAAIPRCTSVELDGAHHLHMDHPERLSELYRWLLMP